MSDRYHPNFENAPRRLQEKKGRPLADVIYRQTFGSGITIARAERDDGEVLDRQHAIDVTISLENGMVILGQEKFLSHKYSHYRSLTIQHWKDPRAHVPGDWFHLASQFYMCGYLTEACTSFDPWVLVKWLDVVLATAAGLIQWQDNRNSDPTRHRSTFRYTIMDDLPAGCIYCSGGLRPR